MSKLYNEALDRYVNNSLDYKYRFNYYLFEVMHYLANEHKSDIKNKYKIIYKIDHLCSDEYYGIKLNETIFEASNKYELWLNIYYYFIKHSKPTLYGFMFGLNQMYQSINVEFKFIEKYIECHNDLESMIYVINSIMLIWEYGPVLYWEITL
jgi:hypothetical protein